MSWEDQIEPTIYVVTLQVESFGNAQDVQSTIYDRLSTTGLMPKAIKAKVMT